MWDPGFDLQHPLTFQPCTPSIPYTPLFQVSFNSTSILLSDLTWLLNQFLSFALDPKWKHAPLCPQLLQYRAVELMLPLEQEYVIYRWVLSMLAQKQVRVMVAEEERLLSNDTIVITDIWAFPSRSTS